VEASGASQSTHASADRGGRPWVVLAGGGTGGHLYPGLALVEALRTRLDAADITFFGTTRPIDERLTAAQGCGLVRQPVQPFPSRPWRWPAFLWNLRRAVADAARRFSARRPAFVLGLGGYAAAPPILAASHLGIPTALFNPDAVPGRANRRLARRVGEIFVQWPQTARHFMGVRAAIHVTGCPVRAAVFRATAGEGRARFGLDSRRRTLLVTGASQGARSINEACVALSDLWRARSDWQLLHLTGATDFTAVRDGYASAGVEARVLDYTDDLPLALAGADLVLSRAGASTLAELTARGVPSVLLPYPYDRARHQRANAEVLAEHGAAVVIDDRREPGANAVRLAEALRGLMDDAARRDRMADAARSLGRPEAADQMAERLLEPAGSSGS